MTDVFSRAKRSEVMSLIRGKNTKPEIVVRRLLHGHGYRYRLHTKLPGRPDVVLPRLKTVIFVHGCFWHHHPRCRFAYVPKSRVDFWLKKFDENRRRDARVRRELRAAGWNVLTVWECETRKGDLSRLLEKLEALGVSTIG